MTEKQRAWIDYYKQGKTATEAARLAGYKAGSDKAFQNIGSENLDKLREFVADRDKVLESGRVADMEEVNSFWTAVMRDENEKMSYRLRASELRAKAAGGFVARLEADIKTNSEPTLTVEEKGMILQALYGGDLQALYGGDLQELYEGRSCLLDGTGEGAEPIRPSWNMEIGKEMRSWGE